MFRGIVFHNFIVYLHSFCQVTVHSVANVYCVIRNQLQKVQPILRQPDINLSRIIGFGEFSDFQFLALYFIILWVLQCLFHIWFNCVKFDVISYKPIKDATKVWIMLEVWWYLHHKLENFFFAKSRTRQWVADSA